MCNLSKLCHRLDVVPGIGQRFHHDTCRITSEKIKLQTTVLDALQLEKEQILLGDWLTLKLFLIHLRELGSGYRCYQTGNILCCFTYWSKENQQTNHIVRNLFTVFWGFCTKSFPLCQNLTQKLQINNVYKLKLKKVNYSNW